MFRNLDEPVPEKVASFLAIARAGSLAKRFCVFGLFQAEMTGLLRKPWFFVEELPVWMTGGLGAWLASDEIT